MTVESALVWAVFGPLLGACALLLVPGHGRLARGASALVVALALLSLPVLLWVATAALADTVAVEVVLGGQAPPLGIGLRLDAFSLLMLWLVAVAGGLSALHAACLYRPGSPEGARFWPVWLLMVAGLNGLFLSADLFNLYVAIELVTLAGVALVAWSGRPGALRAAMRYLLLAMLASLAYLLAVALLYSEHGTLDLYLLAAGMPDAGPATRTALALGTVGLLLKAAIFPLHVWLPPAHSRAPGAVSAVLSALVVKAALYILYRLWFWTLDAVQAPGLGLLLGLLGAAAIIYGSVAALVQPRLKTMVAYSTVAQLGYLMLVFPLAVGAVAGPLAWKGAVYQLLCHGLAKAAMFLAAANLMRGLGSDRLADLAGADRRFGLSVFAFGLAGVSLMGLPPSGGFLAKWLMLEAAWAQQGWGWLGVLMLGSLLAAIYVFRALSAMFAAPADTAAAPVGGRPVSAGMGLTALALALLALVAGFASAPVFDLLDAGPPFERIEQPEAPLLEEAR